MAQRGSPPVAMLSRAIETKTDSFEARLSELGINHQTGIDDLLSVAMNCGGRLGLWDAASSRSDMRRGSIPEAGAPGGEWLTRPSA